jgi:Uma2 family endonuclease
MSTLTTPTSPAAPPALMTADEFTATHAQIRAELVKGIVKGYPMPGFKHGKVCLTIGRLIGNHVEANDLGHVMGNDTWIRTGTSPDTVRGADVCFISYERFPKGEIPDGVVPVAPDLVVEVRSPSDRWTEMIGKMLEYLKAGVRVVVILDPSTTSASVYRDAEEFQQILHNGDPLTLPDVLPGFSVIVKTLFD